MAGDRLAVRRDGAAAQQYNYTLGFWQAPNINTGNHSGICSTKSALYYCPSDSPGTLWEGDTYFRARGNYAVNWGNVRMPPNTSPTAYSPFGYIGFSSTTRPRLTKLNDIKDGTANTLLMSEIIMAPTTANDFRGDLINDDGQCGRFMTLDAPNNGVDESNWGACQNTNLPTAPCVTSGNGKMSARSYHPGGVNAAMCDGTVRFVRDSVDPTAWAAAGTMNGRETLGLD